MACVLKWLIVFSEALVVVLFGLHPLRSKLQQMSNAFAVAQQELDSPEMTWISFEVAVDVPGGLGVARNGAFHLYRFSRNWQDHRSACDVKDGRL